MRAPTPTFKSALIAFRREIMGGSAGPERDLMIGVLDRWADRPEVESVWNTITGAAISYKIEPPALHFSSRGCSAPA